ncbi:MAG: Coenzyme F420 hydrogenase/dehydrogenase, beta subunit C-terminal domain [Clostridiaceae bacterium]
MISFEHKKDCTGCHACANACPEKCISMKDDKEGFLYPEVDGSRCTGCGLCEKVCPICNYPAGSSSMEAWACINRDEDIRSQSSSGGMFTLIAENILKDKGVVFGAAFTEEFWLKHSCTDSLEGLSRYRGSKYMQSEIGDTFGQVKTFLENGTKVLFSGTPCQITGLAAFLGKEYDNLISIDIICHGAPSPKVFRLYKNELEKKNGAVIKSFTFRCKEKGWRKYSISAMFQNGKRYMADSRTDLYMRGFLQDIYLRPSCYHCRAKARDRVSDITIADFWGIDNIAPEMNDDKGTNLVLVHRKKGQDILEKLKEDIKIKQVDPEQALQYNFAAVRSVKYNEKREDFFSEIDLYEDSISELIANKISPTYSSWK